MLYRLSYKGPNRQPISRVTLSARATPPARAAHLERETGLEPATPSLEGWRSSQLSYSRKPRKLQNGGEGRI